MKAHYLPEENAFLLVHTFCAPKKIQSIRISLDDVNSYLQRERKITWDINQSFVVVLSGRKMTAEKNGTTPWWISVGHRGNLIFSFEFHIGHHMLCYQTNFASSLTFPVAWQQLSMNCLQLYFVFTILTFGSSPEAGSAAGDVEFQWEDESSGGNQYLYLLNIKHSDTELTN